MGHPKRKPEQSTDEQKRRLGVQIPVDVMLSARWDTVHVDSGRTRPAKCTRVKKQDCP